MKKLTQVLAELSRTTQSLGCYIRNDSDQFPRFVDAVKFIDLHSKDFKQFIVKDVRYNELNMEYEIVVIKGDSDE